MLAVETNPEPPYGPLAYSEQPITWWWVGYMRLLPSWKGQHFILSAVDTLYNSLPALNAALLQNYYLWFYRMPYSLSWYST